MNLATNLLNIQKLIITLKRINFLTFLKINKKNRYFISFINNE